MPSTKIPMVWGCRNLSAISLEPTDKPRKMVTMLMRAFCAVSDKRSTTPHSRIKLPKQNIPSSGVAEGSSSAIKISSRSGKPIFSSLCT
ncbi:Uncharacterised protein [Vibrio cholerae]|nr:Uncharacterised protein [Vibrio cholerae]